jgi:ferric-dicitrate binding protein FerR (iron transport regulator)
MEGSVKDKREASAELNCQRLGDLAGLAVPADLPSPDARQWAEINRRLDRHGPLLRRLWPALTVAALAILCTAGYLVEQQRPLGYRVVDCALAADGVFTTTAVRTGAIAFNDGSRMLLEKAARFRLRMLPFGGGADIRLEEGDAHLAVAHRPGARWSVQAGPFRIDVTGTRFGVRWSRQLGRFQVTMLEGEVLVAGGAIPPATRLRAGQTLRADLMASSFVIANSQSSPAEARRAGVADSAKAIAAETAKQEPVVHRGPRPSFFSTSLRRRTEIAARGENPAATAPEQAPGESLPATGEQTSALPPANPAVPQAPPPPARPTPSSLAVVPKAASVHVAIGESGQLANGFTGETSVAGGDGTFFSTPASWEERAHLRPEAGLLCTSGTVASLACVNENLPKMHCNWDRNWGVAIGWYTRADQMAWGDGAAGAIAVEFRGRSASYRLNAHLKGDLREKMYCIDNYKSGQAVRPSMFKSECWFDKGDTLADFQQVDLFNLQFSSGMSYVAFRYCVSGITLLIE